MFSKIDAESRRQLSQIRPAREEILGAVRNDRGDRECQRNRAQDGRSHTGEDGNDAVVDRHGLGGLGGFGAAWWGFVRLDA